MTRSSAATSFGLSRAGACAAARLVVMRSDADMKTIPAEESSASKSTGESDARLYRQPPLRLIVEGVPCKPLKAITEDHELYSLAATVWHYDKELAEPLQRALFTTLLERWPSVAGRRGEEYTNTLVYLLHRMGASTSRIAESFWIHPRSIGKKIETGRRRDEANRWKIANGTTTFNYKIEIVTDDESRELCGTGRILPAPLDPGSDEAMVRALGVRNSWHALTPEARADAVERFADVLRGLDVASGDLVDGVPRSSAWAADRLRDKAAELRSTPARNRVLSRVAAKTSQE